MAVYTVHLPAVPASDGRPDFARLQLVKDGFAPFALVFAVFWFVAHRLWWGAAVALALMLLVALFVTALGFAPSAVSAAQIVLGLLFGFEANTVRRWTLERKGMPVVDVVNARDEAEAEQRFLDRATAAHSAVAPPPSLPTRATSVPANGMAGARVAQSDDVLGLFPTPGGVR